MKFVTADVREKEAEDSVFDMHTENSLYLGDDWRRI